MSRQTFPLSWFYVGRNDGAFGTDTHGGQFPQNATDRVRDGNILGLLPRAPLSGGGISRVLRFFSIEAGPDAVWWRGALPSFRPCLDGLPRSGREPQEPGAAVYWESGKSKTLRCMAIDMYDRVADNLAAIAATLSAMRAIERHGGATILDRAFLGFAALPEKATQRWREVLGIEGPTTLDFVESRFRTLAQVNHPDKGGDRSKFEEIVQAREAARLELSA